MRCFKCGEYISSDENYCSMCGQSVPEKTVPQKKKCKCIKVFLAIVGVVGVIAAATCVLIALSHKDKSQCCVRNLLSRSAK